MFIFLILALGLSLGGVTNAQLQFRVIKEWKYINYTWPSEEELRLATSSGAYNPERCIMSGLGYYNGYYYVTTPRMFVGAPATLSRISEGGNTAPLLEPFPSWEKNRIGDCNALQNVQNIEIDGDGNLYVIDSGRTNTMGHDTLNNCRPKLVKYDLKSRDGSEMAREVFRYEFPEHVASSKVNFLYDLVLDNNYVYISDNSGQDPGLIAFSEIDMKSWKIRHGTFKADQNATIFNISGTILQSPLNLAGLALGPQMKEGRLLYYSPLSSYTLFAVNTHELQNPIVTTLHDVHLVGRKTSQTDGMTVDNKGNLYFGLLGSSSISKWNTTQPGFRPRLIAQDPTYVQWPNTFTFNSAGDLIVLCNTLAKFITRRADLNEPNFRLLAGNVGAQSYVMNKQASDNNWSSVMPNSTRDTSDTTADFNDLMIHDIDAPKSGAPAFGAPGCFLVLLAAGRWILQLRN